MDKYLQLLSNKYDSVEKITTEIINLEAILNLPKGTEHFVSDLHGEYDAFDHVLRNGSGNVKQKIQTVFHDRLSTEEMASLAALVYYPEEKLNLTKKQTASQDLPNWYVETLGQLVELCTFSSSKYTRSKVRKALPPEFAYIIEELLYKTSQADKADYYHELLQNIISLGQADHLITAMCYVIQRLVVDHLHVVGDIFDRGPAPDKIIETLMSHHSVDIQWGNHDILWMGAVAGSKACLANVVRICARYDNLDIIEDVYGINLRPLLTLAEKYYNDNPVFRPKINPNKEKPSDDELLQITKIHQAIAIIQFKLEMPIIKRRPEFHMTHRLLLEKIDYTNNTINIKGDIFPLENVCFTTIDSKDPARLLPEEEQVIDKLLYSFQHAHTLNKHIQFLFQKGSMYSAYNDNLLIHGCIPVYEDGSFMPMTIDNKTYKGKALIDIFEKQLRKSYAHREESNDLETDLIWYLWTGAVSSLFGKTDMTTFERYFIHDKSTHTELKNPYYQLRNEEWFCNQLLNEFGLDANKGHIINGHTPVKEKKGENPIKANGKMIVIDGGFSKAYQPTTGIAGYSLLYNSFGMQLAAHQPFTSKEDAIINGTDIISTRRVVDRELARKTVRETNIGKKLDSQSKDLRQLLDLLQENQKFSS